MWQTSAKITVVYVVYCNSNVKINWWPFCLIFVLQTCIVFVFRWLIFNPSNRNSSLCHHMNNIVQYRTTTCSPQFFVLFQGWQYVDCGSTLKYHIIGNFCLQTAMGAKWGWCCIRVWLYFAKDFFRQAVNIQKCILPAACAGGNYWGSSVWVSMKWVNNRPYILDLSDTWRKKEEIQWGFALNSRKPMIHLGGNSCIIFSLILDPHEVVRLIKVSKWKL